MGTVKKPSVFCEARFKLLWESAPFADSNQQRQFPQALFLSFLLLFSFFVPRSSFPQRNFAPGSSRDDDRQLDRPTACVVLAFPSTLHFPKVDRRWRLIAQRLMRAFVIVKNEITFEIGDRLILARFDSLNVNDKMSLGQNAV